MKIFISDKEFVPKNKKQSQDNTVLPKDKKIVYSLSIFMSGMKEFKDQVQCRKNQDKKINREYHPNYYFFRVSAGAGNGVVIRNTCVIA